MNRLALRRWLVAAAALALAASPLFAPPPAWWADRGVLTANTTANDYAAVNLGQVKRIATLARDEMQAKLPGGAGTAINTLVDSWAQPPAVGITRNDYAAVNHGQLKTLAKLYYDRLAEFSYTGQPLSSGQTYPWTATTADDHDYAAANIGQVKHLFSFEMPVAVDSAPVITTQPASLTVATGTVATFQIVASGTAPLSYQWQRQTPGGGFANLQNGLGYAGVTTALFSIDAHISFSGQVFRCVVGNNIAPAATSNTATLTIGAVPQIVTQPLGQTVAPGSSVTLTVAIAGSSAATYQWKKGGVDISGATSASLELSNVSTADNGIYTVHVTNGFGTVVSQNAPIVIGSPPAVALTSPNISQIFQPGASITLSATASDPDGIDRVEFYNGATLIGSDSTSPYSYAWTGAASGRHLLTAKAIDPAGGFATSAPRSILVRPGYPYLLDFEASEGYVVGTLGGQQTWDVENASSAQVVATEAYSGAQSAAIAPYSGSAQVASLALGNRPAGEAVLFFDFWTRPVAGETVGEGSRYGASGMRVGFVRHGALGKVYANDDQGEMGHNWIDTGVAVPIAADGTAERWVRFTVRVNYEANHWDLYVDGVLVAGNFSNGYGAGAPGFSVTGHTVVPVRFDNLLVGTVNPIFVDLDKDGLEYAWEVANGLDPTLDDRNLDNDSDGLSNIQEFRRGTNPSNADTDGDSLPDGWEVQYGLDPKTATASTLDSDGDGLRDVMEFLLGTDPRQADSDGNGVSDGQEDPDGDGILNQSDSHPMDFYNGATPVVTPLEDYSAELGPSSELAVKVTNAQGTPLPNAPIEFTTSAENLLTANPFGSGHSTTLSVRADSGGIARVYVRPAN